MQGYKNIRLIVSSEVAELLEKRRILDEDVQQVIYEAEKIGNVVVHPQTGRLRACHRPFRAAIWVEYSPTPQGYMIHTAYSHRMEVRGGPRK